MSGGSFNYAYLKVDDSHEVFDALQDVRDIENRLRSMGKHDAADEVLLYIKEIETHKRRIEKIGARIAPLLKAVEWTVSCDWGEESIDNAYLELMGMKGEAE